MKCFLIVLTTWITAACAQAQTAEDSVRKVINDLFAGMKNSDAAAIRNCFADSALLQTIARNKEGVMYVRNEQVSAFAQSVGSLPINDADERIQFETIRVDGPLASAWTPYQFYYKGQFSHCGVNSFQLVRLNGQWKIQYLIDTRRKQGCI